VTDPIQEVETSFEQDNFTSRRTTGHNLFDPDSLITGEESAQGLTYQNSSRKFPSAEIRESVIRGEVSQADVVRLYPRTLNQ
jgi:hypothetical protein